MPEFRLSPAAQADLDGIFDYTVQHWGLEQAVRYTQVLESACAAFAAAPAQEEQGSGLASRILVCKMAAWQGHYELNMKVRFIM